MGTLHLRRWRSLPEVIANIFKLERSQNGLFIQLAESD
jgi:hypothetical protein